MRGTAALVWQIEMMILNCTKKLAKRLPYSVIEGSQACTNKLGPWCANSFNISRFPMIILTNERTLLSVVIPFKDIRTFHNRFLKSLEVLFHSIALSSREIQSELEQMMVVQLTDKSNRSTVGSMNDFVYHAKAALYEHQNLSLEELSFELSGIPCSPLNYGFPREEVLNVITPPHPGRMEIRRD